MITRLLRALVMTERCECGRRRGAHGGDWGCGAFTGQVGWAERLFFKPRRENIKGSGIIVVKRRGPRMWIEGKWLDAHHRDLNRKKHAT